MAHGGASAGGQGSSSESATLCEVIPPLVNAHTCCTAFIAPLWPAFLNCAMELRLRLGPSRTLWA
eukprot:9504103-Pyramimonas_sp.AAC.1